MKRKIFFVTGTDTGVGKTVLTVLLVKFLCVRDFNVAGIKPICSGDRGDAKKIFAAMNGALFLDEINAWHFRTPVAPLLAARRQGKKVKLPQVLAHVRDVQKRFEILLVEGAGGLLSPLGENFDSRDLILALRATPIIVAQNKIGVVNQILLTLEALPKNLQARALVVLMSPRKPDAATKSNARLLAQFFAAKRIFTLPWMGGNFSAPEVLKNPRVRRTLFALTNQ
jgi:dethiobiotin synthetase